MKKNNNKYMNEYMKKRYKNRREECIEILGGLCVKCGESNHQLLEFDHIKREEKEIDIGDALLWSKKRLLEEIKKCQLLCVLCHKEKTLNDLGRLDARKNHGTLSSYRYCKCEECRKFKSEYNRKHKKIDDM